MLSTKRLWKMYTLNNLRELIPQRMLLGATDRKPNSKWCKQMKRFGSYNREVCCKGFTGMISARLSRAPSSALRSAVCSPYCQGRSLLMVTGRLPATTGLHGPRSTSGEQNFQKALWSASYSDLAHMLTPELLSVARAMWCRGWFSTGSRALALALGVVGVVPTPRGGKWLCSLGPSCAQKCPVPGFLLCCHYLEVPKNC